MTSNSQNWNLGHIGFVVRDMEKAMEHYQALGMGPFKSVPLSRPIKRSYMGASVPPERFGFNVRVGKLGPILVEFVQPVKGETIQKTFLDTKGEGINHLAFEVDDLDEARTELENIGFKVIQSTEFENGECALFFDTDRAVGLVIELLPRNSTVTKAGK